MDEITYYVYLLGGFAIIPYLALRLTKNLLGIFNPTKDMFN